MDLKIVNLRDPNILLDINNAAVPDINTLDISRAEWLVSHLVTPGLALLGEKPVGIVVVLSDQCGFQSDYYRLLAEDDKRKGLHSIYMRAASTAEALLTDPRDVSILHGDIHHENIRHHAQRGWLAFDPKGLVGESTFDAANTLCNPINVPALVEDETRLLNNAEILARGLNVELPRVLAFTFAYVCLSASWGLGDNVEPRHELRIAEIVEPHIRHF